jgi:hypothetical protein
MSSFLEESYQLNFNHPEFQVYLKQFQFGTNQIENAKEIYFKIVHKSNNNFNYKKR